MSVHCIQRNTVSLHTLNRSGDQQLSAEPRVAHRVARAAEHRTVGRGAAGARPASGAALSRAGRSAEPRRRAPPSAVRCVGANGRERQEKGESERDGGKRRRERAERETGSTGGRERGRERWGKGGAASSSVSPFAPDHVRDHSLTLEPRARGPLVSQRPHALARGLSRDSNAPPRCLLPGGSSTRSLRLTPHLPVPAPATHHNLGTAAEGRCAQQAKCLRTRVAAGRRQRPPEEARRNEQVLWDRTTRCRNQRGPRVFFGDMLLFLAE